MSIVKDRVKETSTTTGTGDITLAGADTGFKAFSAVFSVGDQTYYTIANSSTGEFEVGRGSYSAANTLSRLEVYSSSNSDAKTNFGAGTKIVFVTYPADRSVTDDTAAALAIALGG